MAIILSDINSGDGDIGHYLLRIDKKTILTFQHKRSENSLARCLREAADAVDLEQSRLCGDRWLDTGKPFLAELNDYPKRRGAKKVRREKSNKNLTGKKKNSGDPLYDQ